MNDIMGAQEHVALVRSHFELYNNRQSDPAWLDKSMAEFAADSEVVNAAAGTTFHGPQGYKRFLRFHTESFPDLRIELTNVFAAEDRVVAEGRYRGTNMGSRNLSPGALPTAGRPGEVWVCHVLQFKHGKIVSLHAYYDLTTLLEQFGLNAATAEAT